MNIVDEILEITSGKDERLSLLWGQVIGVSPMLVRLAGDTVDTTIGLRLGAYIPTTTDKVLVARMGTTLIVLGSIV